VGDGYAQIEQAVASLPVSQNSVTYDFAVRVPATGEKRRIRSSVFIERNTQGHPTRLVGISRRID
jgi:RNA:NAD 2'-phosphotransferase (TPT1/KptA family)